MKVYIIGVGPGAEDYVLPVARSAIEKSDCLIGAKRLVALFRNLGKEEVLIEGHFKTIAPYIKKYKDKKKIAVLVSGDPGVYSFLGQIQTAFKKEEYAVIPGISALQLAFARIGESWQDAKIISVHGRKPGNLAGEVKDSGKVFLFTDTEFSPGKIAVYLLNSGVENRRAVVFEALSYPGERIIETNLKQLSRMKISGLCAVIIEKRKVKIAEGKLYGIGIGPGDPKLVTLKAK